MKIEKNFLLENLTEEDEDTIEYYMTGTCIAFAVALKEIFPDYQMAVLLDEKELDEDEEVEYDFDFVHAFCYKDDKSNTIIDARGVRPQKELYEDFYDINPRIDWDIRSSKSLIDEYAGKEFYSEETYDYDVVDYQNAKKFIKKHINIYKI
jgi:hypothetical protein